MSTIQCKTIYTRLGVALVYWTLYYTIGIEGLGFTATSGFEGGRFEDLGLAGRVWADSESR